MSCRAEGTDISIRPIRSAAAAAVSRAAAADDGSQIRTTSVASKLGRPLESKGTTRSPPFYAGGPLRVE